MPTAEAYYRTPKGSQYLQQLCKHFSHKREVSFTPEEGTVVLSSGTLRLWADAEGLRAEVTSPDQEALEHTKDVADKHLARFAFRENFEHLPWGA